jgi:hypothetical protein
LEDQLLLTLINSKKLFEGILKQGIQSQLECKESMPKSFECFSSARVAMDATEIRGATMV